MPRSSTHGQQGSKGECCLPTPLLAVSLTHRGWPSCGSGARCGATAAARVACWVRAPTRCSWSGVTSPAPSPTRRRGEGKGEGVGCVRTTSAGWLGALGRQTVAMGSLIAPVVVCLCTWQHFLRKPTARLSTAHSSSCRQKRLLLNSISGSALPGRLTAIMGPSGSVGAGSRCSSIPEGCCCAQGLGSPTCACGDVQAATHQCL